MPSNGHTTVHTGDEVIQVTSNDLEEVKVFDQESARQFSIQGVSTAPNSFADPTMPFDETCPPPKYLSDELITVPLSTLKEEYLRGLLVNSEGCLVCTDQEALNK